MSIFKSDIRAVTPLSPISVGKSMYVFTSLLVVAYYYLYQLCNVYKY